MRTMGEFWHLAGDFMGEISAGPGRASAGIFESFHHARIGEFLALPQIAAVDFLTHSETHFAGKNPLQDRRRTMAESVVERPFGCVQCVGTASLHYAKVL